MFILISTLCWTFKGDNFRQQIRAQLRIVHEMGFMSGYRQVLIEYQHLNNKDDQNNHLFWSKERKKKTNASTETEKPSTRYQLQS